MLFSGLRLTVGLLLCAVPAHCACATGETGPQCKDGKALASTFPPCAGGPPQCCKDGVCKDAPKPTGGGGQGQQPPGGGGGGGTVTHNCPGTATSPGSCVNPSCASPPCAAKLLGNVGCTTLEGPEAFNHEMLKKGGVIPCNSHIFGPFEAGFTSRQKSIIENWGCTDASVAYDTEGGTDIDIAEMRVSHLCNVKVPRTVGDTYYGVVGPCGGHTHDYHFHRSFNCLYEEEGGHSTAVGNIAQWKLYGKWEDNAAKKLPLLDACGAHFGVTPDSNGARVYHYHVQDKAPHAVGCHGPTADNKLVSVAQCRALYPECSKPAVELTINATTKVSYVRFCPCYDADGKNTGTIKELPALLSGNIDGPTTTTGSPGKSTPKPTTTVAAKPTTTTATTVKITGGLTMSVPDVDAFLADKVAQEGVKEGVAKAHSTADHVVFASHVALQLSKARRLAAADRRLAGSVRVGYTIDVPTSVKVAAEKAAKDVTSAQLTTAIQKTVTAKKGSNYVISVTAKETPVVTVVGATSATVSNPDSASLARVTVVRITGLLLVSWALLVWQ